MSDVFQSYEKQYQGAVATIREACSGAATLSPEQRRAKLMEVRSTVDEADSLVRKMDLEARGLQPAERAKFLTKLKDYKTELNNVKREVKKLTMGDISSRESLLQGGQMTASEEHRMQLASSTDRVYQTGERIREGKRLLVETEDLGVSVLQDLHRQRETLLRATDTLHGVDDAIARGKVIIHNISKRITRNKYIMGGIIGFLLLAIIIVFSGKKGS